MKHSNVALFVPNNGCPHRCSFCNQRSITGKLSQPTPNDVAEAARIAKKSLGERTKNAEIAFFGGSFTAVERGYMVSLLEAASPFLRDGSFAGIRISTRPDAIDPEILAVLKRYGVTAIELGAQSMDDRVLPLNGRGHTAAQVEEASRQIRAGGFSLGLQMMTGLYGSTPEKEMRTARKLAALFPDTVRIYPTVVLRGTELGNRYLAGAYRPPELEATVDLCADLLDFFEEKGITVIRLGLHASKELERDRLAGPWHPAFRELCESRRLLLKIKAELEREGRPPGSLRIHVNPSGASIAAGQKKSNLAALCEAGFPARIVPDETVERGRFFIE